MGGNTSQRQVERRSSVPVSREQMWASMNDPQRDTVERLQSHGWQLRFVRYGAAGAAEPVVSSAESGALGVVGVDGGLQLTPSLPIRR